jgi:hypothetical protein
LVNLSYAYTDIATLNTANLNTASGPAWTTASSPAGSGTVSQLNFGTIANAGTAGFTNFTVVAAAGATQSGITSITGASLTSGSNPSSITISGLGPVVQNIQMEIAAWNSLTTSGTYFDATGSSTAAAAIAPSSSGTWNNGGISTNFVGTAAAFYSVLGNTSFSSTVDGIAKRSTATTAYNGFWFLSSTGQLTYNIASAAAPVPLPAAVWLLGSGLLGLIGVGRRRSAAV